MKLVKEFNQYLANLAVVTFKLHNVHWNTVGTQFVRVHEYTEELYDETFEFFDAVAEILKMNDVTPDSRLADYLKNASGVFVVVVRAHRNVNGPGAGRGVKGFKARVDQETIHHSTSSLSGLRDASGVREAKSHAQYAR